MSKYLELPWSVEDTIENLKELKDGLQERCIIQNFHGRGEKDAEEIAFDFDRAINALEEIQQYRSIGTPEEFLAAVEKQKEIRNKSVDDFAKWLESKKYLMKEIREHDFCYTHYDELKADYVKTEFFAEQLKAGDVD